MANVTAILSAIDEGDPRAAEQLLPLVYEELRRLAAQKLLQEKPGQTLEATALVHEAYLRLVDTEKVQQWNSRGHFYAAAAEAMRRILVAAEAPDDLLALDEALEQLTASDPQAAEVVKLRYFAGLTVPQTAEVLDI